MDPDKLLVHFERCIMMAEELELSFWDEVDAYRGFFGMRMLIHAMLVAKGVRRYVPETEQARVQENRVLMMKELI